MGEALGDKITAAKLTRGTLAEGRHPAGDGLYLLVSATGKRAWIVRFASPIHRRPNGRGRAREMGVGSYPLTSLAEARQAAQDARKLVKAGIDPIDHREAQRMAARAQAALAITFKACAEAYIEAHEGTWRNAKHRQQWRNTLEAYAYPKIGDLAAQAVDRAAVLRVVEPIWHDKPETANRVRGRIERIIDWAVGKGFRPEGANPARWKGGIGAVLPSRSKVRRVKHHAALPYREIPGLVDELASHRVQSPSVTGARYWGVDIM